MAVGYDAIRIKFRNERRKILREILLKQLHGADIEAFIRDALISTVDPSYIDAVMEDLHEDLAEIGPHSIAGLGVTTDDLKKWLHKQNKT